MTQILKRRIALKRIDISYFMGCSVREQQKEKELGLDYTEYVLQYMGA